MTPIPPGLTHVLHRGEVQQKREEVTPGGLEALAMRGRLWTTSQADDGSRRAHLSDWITDVRNPLFARVVVNRIWMHHFGQGLVLTPNDFGVSEGRSHPELLDWMAWYLIDHEWSLKALHRLILTSATWQQQSSPRAEAMEKDADNRLLWRMVPRRLEEKAYAIPCCSWRADWIGKWGNWVIEDMKEYKFKGVISMTLSHRISPNSFDARSIVSVPEGLGAPCWIPLTVLIPQPDPASCQHHHAAAIAGPDEQ